MPLAPVADTLLAVVDLAELDTELAAVELDTGPAAADTGPAAVAHTEPAVAAVAAAAWLQAAAALPMPPVAAAEPLADAGCASATSAAPAPEAAGAVGPKQLPAVALGRSAVPPASRAAACLEAEKWQALHSGIAQNQDQTLQTVASIPGPLQQAGTNHSAGLAAARLNGLRQASVAASHHQTRRLRCPSPYQRSCSRVSPICAQWLNA
mmetsp:Transcript_61710/g.109587  ORF Transcript_61710/g.109587 Transcript_61710/m.109587 type:complete len:209 (-) Transcript_61710:1015-1641(-)